MATAKNTIENAISPMEDQTVSVVIPLLEEDVPGSVEQTVEIGRNGTILRVQRGVRVDIPVWAFIILKDSGKYPNL